MSASPDDHLGKQVAASKWYPRMSEYPPLFTANGEPPKPMDEEECLAHFIMSLTPTVIHPKDIIMVISREGLAIGYNPPYRSPKPTTNPTTSEE